MSDQTKKTLSSFMKKQISEKSQRKNLVKKPTSVAGAAKSDAQNKDGEKNEDPNQEEMSEEEQLEEAKKESRNKAAQTDQSEMIKKLILETTVKYTIIIAVMVIFAIGMIKFGSVILAYLNGLIFKLLMSALHSK